MPRRKKFPAVVALLKAGIMEFAPEERDLLPEPRDRWHRRALRQSALIANNAEVAIQRGERRQPEILRTQLADLKDLHKGHPPERFRNQGRR